MTNKGLRVAQAKLRRHGQTKKQRMASLKNLRKANIVRIDLHKSRKGKRIKTEKVKKPVYGVRDPKTGMFRGSVPRRD